MQILFNFGVGTLHRQGQV